MTSRTYFRAIGERLGPVLSPARLNDANALLYSAKSFAAAMLAYFIALFIGLERPSWAIITVYIVSQTSVGASLSRCLYRLAGTVAGAAATVLIIPAFVNMPVVCSMLLTVWITFCLYLSLLERTPRAYAYVLAGYTASLIGFPAVSSPEAIFSIAIIRVQEIIIGILCAGIIHRYVLPIPIASVFHAKLSQTLDTVRLQIADCLTGTTTASASLHLATSLQFLQGINHHLAYDFFLSVPIGKARRALHDRLARLLLIHYEIQDRLQSIALVPDDIQSLLCQADHWLRDPNRDNGKSVPEALNKQTEALIHKYHAQAPSVEICLCRRLIDDLAEALTLFRQCERLAGSLYHMQEPPLESEDDVIQGYVFHRDPWSAARTALGAFTIIWGGCLMWIYSAWPEGATAVSILGVCCTLFGGFDAPVPHIVKYIIGCLWGVSLSLIYCFVLLPDISDFIVLVAVFAPAYLLAGSLQARPPTTFMAMGITLTLPVLCDLGAHYSGNLADVLNTSLALFVATGFAVIGMSLLQTVQATSAINRLVKLCQRDLARCIKGTFKQDETYWINLMIDRAALLLPRLQRSPPASAQALSHLLYTLRLGLCVMRLRRRNRPLSPQMNALLVRLESPSPPRGLEEHINTMIDRYLPGEDKHSRQLVDGLIELHRILREHNKG